MTNQEFQEHQKKQSELKLSGRKCCKEYGLRYSTWCYWKRKTQAKRVEPKQPFIELTSEPKATITISHPHGFQVQLDRGFDSALLQKTLEVIARVKS